MTPNNRANFGSKLGAILAAAGSAVGLGNIWRFPYETGEHGGAAFILVYIGCVLLFGVPIMIAEFSIGRRSRANTARAYQILAPGTPWRWVGRMGVLTGFLILGYYVVVSGWTLEFIMEAATNSFAGKSADEFIASFSQFTAHPWRPIVWAVVFMLATHFIVVKGVEKGIEKSAKIMMPMLFILLLILAGCAVALPNAGAGLEFLLKPDFSKVNGSVLLGAIGQAFFSLSIGMGCLCTYASYFKADTNLPKTAFSVAIIDTSVAVLAGIIIFPAAFSVGIQPDMGPSLLFVTLPNVFQQAFGNLPWLAVILSVMFYILLALAALTSTGHRQGVHHRGADAVRPLRLRDSQDYAAAGRLFHCHLHGLVPGQAHRVGGVQQSGQTEGGAVQAAHLPAEVHCPHRHCLHLHQRTGLAVRRTRHEGLLLLLPMGKAGHTVAAGAHLCHCRR